MTTTVFRTGFIFSLLALLTFGAFVAPGSDSVAKIAIPTALQQSDSLKVWVYFTDKGVPESALQQQAIVSVAALARRARRGAAIDFGYYDTPPNPDYVAQIRSISLRTRVESRWLNAVSAWVTPEALEQIAELPFVSKLTAVAQYQRRPVAETPQQGFHKPTSALQLDYGDSFGQLDQIGIVELHEQGYTGEGVRILMLDTGFKISHEAFAHLEVDTTWDFINDDVDVEDDANSQQRHGTATLSLIGSFAPGEMIGAAYGASFLLAKTEREPYTVEAEIADADDWVAGIEWGEPLGADIVSSSLGYDTLTGLTYEDLDGNTVAVTVAADAAAALGVIVVNSVGNGGRSRSEPTLIAPADGDSVIAVGAVDSVGVIAGFSSNGPTYDRRLKPDVCAQGVSVKTAWYSSSSSYRSSFSGTSSSCPLTAGAVALILEARPNWAYGDIYDALTSTASRADSPDTVYGYGIIDAVAAVGGDDLPTVSSVRVAPNPFAGSVNILVPVADAGLITVRLYTIAAEEVTILEKQALTARTVPVTWDGTNATGERVVDGIYLAYVIAPGVEEVVKIVKIGASN